MIVLIAAAQARSARYLVLGQIALSRVSLLLPWSGSSEVSNAPGGLVINMRCQAAVGMGKISTGRASGSNLKVLSVSRIWSRAVSSCAVAPSNTCVSGGTKLTRPWSEPLRLDTLGQN